MITRKVFSLIALVLVLSSLVPLTAYATGYTWNGGSSNAWNVSANWTGGTFPNSYSDTATIGVAANTPVSLTTTALLGGGGTALTLTNITSSPTGLDIASGGTLGMQGNIVLSSSSTNGRKITIEGILRNDAATSATTYSVTGGTNAGDILQLIGGTISSLNGGIWSFSRPIQGYGILSAPFTNTNTISANVSGQTLHIAGNSSAAGTMVSATGATLSLESALTGVSFGSGAGAINLNGGTVTGLTNNSPNQTVNLTNNSTIGGVVTQNQYLYLVLNGYTLNFASTTYGDLSSGSNPAITVGTGILNNASGNSTTGSGDSVTVAGGSITNNGGTFLFNCPITGYGLVSGASLAQQAITATGGTTLTPRTLTYNGGAGVSLGSH
jgi:hypothetical protein